MRRTFIISIVLGTLVLGGCTFSIGKKQAPAVRGVFKSIDKAQNWQAKNLFVSAKGAGNIGGLDVISITFDPTDKNAIYLTSSNGGLMYSYDGGESWQKAAGIPNARIEGVAIDHQNKCVVYATLANTLKKTVDCSRTWREIYVDTRTNKPISALAMDPKNNQVIYAGNTGGDILRSIDGGGEWQVIQRFTDKVVKFAFDPNDSRTFYVATAKKGIYRTTDVGLTWVNLSDGLKEFKNATDYRNLIVDRTASNSLLLVSKYGLLRSTDGGITWVSIPLLTPINGADILASAMSPANNQEIYYSTATTFYKTNDGGQNWITLRLPSSARPAVLEIPSFDASLLWMGFIAQPTK
jgi:photosystem II stability/assembly factor-like uncharacterized protein